MASENAPIEVNVSGKGKQLIYYQDSYLQTVLRYYPYFLFGVFGLFLIIAYLLFSAARKSEQNQVWAGLARETAHQLGTPLSSLLAWIELLKLQGVDENTVYEITKDVNRLETITARFRNWI